MAFPFFISFLLLFLVVVLPLLLGIVLDAYAQQHARQHERYRRKVRRTYLPPCENRRSSGGAHPPAATSKLEIPHACGIDKTPSISNATAVRMEINGKKPKTET